MVARNREDRRCVNCFHDKVEESLYKSASDVMFLQIVTTAIRKC